VPPLAISFAFHAVSVPYMPFFGWRRCSFRSLRLRGFSGDSHPQTRAQGALHDAPWGALVPGLTPLEPAEQVTLHALEKNRRIVRPPDCLRQYGRDVIALLRSEIDMTIFDAPSALRPFASLSATLAIPALPRRPLRDGAAGCANRQSVSDVGGPQGGEFHGGPQAQAIRRARRMGANASRRPGSTRPPGCLDPRIRHEGPWRRGGPQAQRRKRPL
jgi:hypothetical protein